MILLLWISRYLVEVMRRRMVAIEIWIPDWLISGISISQPTQGGQQVPLLDRKILPFSIFSIIACKLHGSFTVFFRLQIATWSNFIYNKFVKPFFVILYPTLSLPRTLSSSTAHNSLFLCCPFPLKPVSSLPPKICGKNSPRIKVRGLNRQKAKDAGA